MEDLKSEPCHQPMRQCVFGHDSEAVYGLDATDEV
jgi:hypothetical protein